MENYIEINSEEDMINGLKTLKEQGFIISNCRFNFMVTCWSEIALIYGDKFSKTISCIVKG